MQIQNFNLTSFIKVNILLIIVSFGISKPAYTETIISQIQYTAPATIQNQVNQVRSFVNNYVNRVPDLNLTPQQIEAIISYFDADPSAIPINLSLQQIDAIRVFFTENLDELANLNISQSQLTNALTFITGNSRNISSLLVNNPNLAVLLRELSPQVNQLAALNPQLRIIITTLRTTVPEINSLLTI